MKNILSLFLLIFIFPCFSQAQTIIKGNVKDSSGRPIPFCTVLVKGKAIGASTDTLGNYEITTNDTGRYILVVSMAGFDSRENPVILQGGIIELNFVLKSSVSDLTTVTIIAGSFEAGDKKKSAVMTARDISTTAGGNGDVSTVMNTLPGTQKIGEEEGLFVRGGAGVETKTVIDEMIVQSPFFSSVPSVPQKGRFSPFLFKGTVFSTGGYSAVYGQALSSVLLLNTDDLPESSFMSVGLMPFGGSLGNTKRWSKSALSIDASYANMKPYFSIMPQLTEWEKPPESINGSVFFKKQVSENGFLKVFSSFGYSTLSLYSLNPDNLPVKNKFSNINTNYYGFANYKNVIGDKWRYFIGASYSFDDDHKYFDTINISSEKSLAQGKVIFKREIFKNGSNLTLGYEVQSNRIQSTFDTISSRLSGLYQAAFSEGEIYLSKRTAIRAGGRFEYSGLLGAASVAPRVSFAYKINAFSILSAAYGDFYQDPETRYLFINPGLKYEHSRHYILSYQLEKKKRLFRVELYEKEYKNLVKYNPDSIQTTLNNSGYGFARGVDVFWRDNKVTFKNMDYWISYSFIATKRNYLGYPVLATPGFAPQHNLSVVYKYNIKKIKTHLGFTYTYASGRPYYNPNLPEPEFNSQLTPEFHNLSIGVSKYGFIKEKHFYVIYASVNNVLNRENIFGYKYSADGVNRVEVQPAALRSFFIGAFISIDRSKK